MNQAEADVLWLWDYGLDTFEIAECLEWKEHEVERVLWAAREKRTASKRGSSDGSPADERTTEGFAGAAGGPAEASRGPDIRT